MKPLAKIPYGIADYVTIRTEDMIYVDKTSYIEELENMGRYLFFLRPRRFGKSLLINQMGTYYNVLNKDRFQELFSGTYIGDHPTPKAGSFLVLKLNFSVVDPDPNRVMASFNSHVDLTIMDFISRYREIVPFIEDLKDQVKEKEHASDKLEALFKHLTNNNLKLCLLIDEYDNFTNTILSMKDIGKATYEAITHGTGFYRNFFNTLKDGAGGEGACLARLFVTGVSPVTMDDLTSGFNIGEQVSLSNSLARAAGFTRADVEQLMDQYAIDEMLQMSRKELMTLLERWYGNYRFSEKEKEGLFNPDMILYFLKQVTREGEMPREMIDNNVRIDYGKLHHLVAVDRQLNGNFSRIRQVLSEGHLNARISEAFPLEELIQEQNFISLLYYFGLVTLHGAQKGQSRLEIPNQTIAFLMYGFLRTAMERTGVFQLKFYEMTTAVNAMAYDGEWQEFFKYLGEQIKEQTSVRDFIDGEKVVQAFLLAWLSTTDFFRVRSEYEANKGFCDLYVEPFVAKYPDICFGYLVEIKYIKRGEGSEANLNQKIAEKVEEARVQLAQYRQDPHLDKVGGNITWICPILVFHGWELVEVTQYQN